MAVGDLMGSSLFNLLILAVADLSFKSRGQMLSRAAAAHALSGTMSIALTALAALGIAVSSKVENATVGGVGIGSLVIAAGYVLGLRLAYYDQRVAARGSEAGQHALPIGNMTLRRAILQYVAAAAAIFAAAPFLAQAAGDLADATGLGKTFIGTTLVALSTSLPELVATLAAVRMGAFDLALGNIFGSNSFNMVLLLPLDLFHPGSLLAAASPTHAITGMCAIVVTSVAVMGQLYQVEKRTRFLEPDAVMMIGLILAALGLVYYLGE
jgi:cation:H+ antiporter